MTFSLKELYGPIKLTMTSGEAIRSKWLSRPNFVIAKSYSPSSYFNRDALRMIAAHLYNNSAVHEQAAKIANNVIDKLGHKVLIAVDHVDQFKYILPHLKYECGFAHGPLTKKNKTSISKEYHKSDPEKLVQKFNDGKLKLLVGTSCISIGTDIPPLTHIINLQGGTSEVKFKQLVGRATRIIPGEKEEFWFTDFSIENIPQLKAHCAARVKIYNDIWPNVTYNSMI